jgi:hypothetical protein
MIEWKPVKDYEGYEISSRGDVRNVKTGRILKHGRNKGYASVNLYTGERKYKTKKIHRLIAEAFIDNPDGLPVINHKNGDKLDNRIENLEWCTQAHNIKHMIDEGLHSGKGGTHWNARLTDAIVLKMRDLRSAGRSVNEIAKQFGVKANTASSAISGVTWAHL